MTDTIEAVAGRKKGLWTWIFNPFYYLTGGQALAWGLAFILAAGLVGSAVNAHLDGILDAHVGLVAPIWMFPLEGVADWLSMGLVLWLMGLLLSRTRFRALDVFGAQALARVPALLNVAVAFLPGFQPQAMRLATGNLDVVPLEMAQFVAGMFVTILVIIWMAALMYRGFATSCNVRGGKAVGAFIAALIVAEILSKAAIIGLLFLAIPDFHILPSGQ